MANYAKLGNEAKPVSPRHGMTGYVPLTADIPADLKSELVIESQKGGRTIKEIVIDALSLHLEWSPPE